MAPHPDNGGDRPKENLHVLRERLVFDVEVVDRHPVLDGGSAAEIVYLRQPGKARGNPQSVRVSAIGPAKLAHVAWLFRPRTHEAHVTADDVPQLGQLVE